MERRDFIKRSSSALLPLLLPFDPSGLIMPGDSLLKSHFGNDFKWGVAAASYQIEGAWNEDGKGPSIWDTFTHKKKNILNNENGDIACDFYHRYHSDIEMMKQMNMDVFRFSLSWSRIFPEGVGKVNQKGIDFYHRVIDRCLELDIEPWITLFHWDLPQALQDRGGWPEREIINWFSEYVDKCTREYGSKVKNWMILNEPMAFTAVGHMLGMHAPGDRSVKKFLKSSHHAAMCQAEGGRIARANVSGGNIGTTFSCSHVDPKNEKHEKAAVKIDVLINRLFIEPALGMGYPVDDLKLIRKIEKYMEPGDADKLKFNFDFIGVQNYSRIIARRSIWPPIVWANQVDPKKMDVETTEMGWEVNPEGIYKVLKQFSAYEGIDKIIVTENGAAFPDVLENGRVHDTKRVEFFKNYLSNVLKAKNEGVNVQGYLVWTFMDNFEWAEGYHPRFGIVYNDFKSQKRYIKDSGLWFQEFLK